MINVKKNALMTTLMVFGLLIIFVANSELKLLRKTKIHDILFFVVKETHGQLAQLVEQRTLNPWVQGSSP